MAKAYAENSDFEAYVEGWTTTNADALTRLLERASDDLDWMLGDYTLIQTGDWTDRKIDPSTLDYDRARALKRAACAQAEYRNLLGEEFFTRPKYANVSGPEFTTEGTTPTIGPKAMRELSGSGLLRNSTSIARRRAQPSWLDFSYNLDGLYDGDYGGLRR